MRIIVLKLWFTNSHNYLDIYPPFLHYYLQILFLLLTDHMHKFYFIYLYIPMQFCHKKHTANIQMKKKNLVNMVCFH